MQSHKLHGSEFCKAPAWKSQVGKKKKKTVHVLDCLFSIWCRYVSIKIFRSMQHPLSWSICCSWYSKPCGSSWDHFLYRIQLINALDQQIVSTKQRTAKYHCTCTLYNIIASAEKWNSCHKSILEMHTIAGSSKIIQKINYEVLVVLFKLKLKN